MSPLTDAAVARLRSVATWPEFASGRYSVTAGRYRDDQLQDKPVFVQGTYQRGISNLWTGYTGSIIADQYMAVQGGLALSTPVGAFAFDVTHSSASGLDAEEELSGSSSGQSYRLSYSKLVETTRTNFVVAAYRFSSAGYLSFSDFTQSRDATAQSPRRQRNRLQVNVNQPLGDHYGSLFVSGSAQNYWQTGEDGDVGYQAGYSNSFRWGSMSLSASRTETDLGETDTQYMLTLSLPLGHSSHAPHLNSSTTYSDKGDLNSQAGISGSLEHSTSSTTAFMAHAAAPTRTAAAPAGSTPSTVQPAPTSRPATAMAMAIARLAWGSRAASSPTPAA